MFAFEFAAAGVELAVIGGRVFLASSVVPEQDMKRMFANAKSNAGKYFSRNIFVICPGTAKA